MCEHCNRREFLEASGLGGLMLAVGNWTAASFANSTPPPPPGKPKIAVIFAGPPGPSDRGWNVDPSQKEAIQNRLRQAEQDLANVELILGEARNAEETRQVLQQVGEAAPVLVINMHIGALLRMVEPIRKNGHPLAVFSLPASGHDWMYPFRWQWAGDRATLLASSDLNELERAVRLLRVPPLMKRTRIVLFLPARGTPPACSPEKVKECLGADVVVVEQARFDEMLQAADEAAVREEAKWWTENAKEIVEPNEEDILKAARVSIALQQLMDQEQAQGLAVGTCMGWLPRGFPCLGFARLRDKGIPAACEGDMDSLLTMLLFQYAFDIPGFQGNATFDTSKNALWTAHCTAPLKMDGPEGPVAPFLLRGHSEVQGSGCVPEVQYRIGQVVTRAKLINLDTMLLSTGKIIEVPARSVRACRTQIVTEVRDAVKMAYNWSSAVPGEDMMTLLHRVVFYGDHTQSVYHLCHLMGLKVIEEG